MATEICITCLSCKKEKSWRSDSKGKPLNRHTVEFSVEWMPEVTESGTKSDNKYEGSTFTLSTLSESEAERFKIGKKYTLTLKPE